VRSFSLFLQRSVEMGKTSAGMCIERMARARHNVQHQVANAPPRFFTHDRERAMNNFNLHTPTRILFGKGAIADLHKSRLTPAYSSLTAAVA
jgi:NADP-dependent alcohol dehydrogenase